MIANTYLKQIIIPTTKAMTHVIKATAKAMVIVDVSECVHGYSEVIWKGAYVGPEDVYVLQRKAGTWTCIRMYVCVCVSVRVYVRVYECQCECERCVRAISCAYMREERRQAPS